ncbi:MAG TPA: hypothetical protein VLX91_13050 [Candidatus Acidoferrales bacterium]|nr:hypothetical protein [Candidatus Acidoferrales bacterium]
MRTLDCGIFYEWEYDKDFVSILSNELKSANLSNKIFARDEFGPVLEKLHRKTLAFRTIVDRASDVDDICESIVNFHKCRQGFVLNDPEKVRHSSDKASMHLEFMTAGVYVPYTIIISPYNAQQEIKLSIDELACLGRPFIIKPANTTGGGIGVITGAESLREVIDTRQHNKDDKYLLQRKIEPTMLENRRAWFRPFYVFGKIFICWWDDRSHVYFETSNSEIEKHNLQEIERVARKIHDVCGLDFFSTEIALSTSGQFIVIDYVNEMCDMRVKSNHFDGVPDAVVEAIAKQIGFGLSNQCHKE